MILNHVEFDAKNYLILSLLIKGVQTQQGFAYAHQVNLLAAGASKTVPGGSDVLNTGSGIYSGRFGALKAFTAINSPTTKILIAEVPKKPADHPANMTMPEESDNSVLLPGPKLLKADLTEYNVKFLDFDTNSTQAGHLCQGSLCCDYNIRASTNNSFSQKALVMMARPIEFVSLLICLKSCRHIIRMLLVFSMAFANLVMPL